MINKLASLTSFIIFIYNCRVEIRNNVDFKFNKLKLTFFKWNIQGDRLKFQQFNISHRLLWCVGHFVNSIYKRL